MNEGVYYSEQDWGLNRKKLYHKGMQLTYKIMRLLKQSSKKIEQDWGLDPDK